MNILLTNDDGYNAPGILLLKKKLAKYGKVVIVAPYTHMSGKSCSISIGKTFKVHKIEEDVFALETTPADCVCFGLNSLNMDFDIVISGCNDGWNVSWDTLFSGTIGAASEALHFFKPVVAFSCEHNFDLVDEYFDKVFDFINKHKLISNEYILNVNFPLGEEIKGIEITDVHHRENDFYWHEVRDGEYITERVLKEENAKPGTDWYAIHHGIVSISIMNKTLGNEELTRKVREKIK